MQYCNLHDRSNGLFLGYFSLLAEVLSKYPEGVPEGSYFVNGETLSIWVWNDTEKEWMDTNRPMQSPLSGVVDDPATYRPEVVKGVKAYYLYISPPAENLCFVHFDNGDEPLRITVEQSAVISLFWDGDFWHVYITPVKLEAFQAEAYTDFRFQLSTSEDTPPQVNRLSVNPGEGWVSQIPESGEGLFLWMISAKLDGNGDFCDAETGWSAPVRLTGDKGSTGPNGENSYCMVLSNDSHTIPCQKDGSGGYYDGAHTTCYVFEGSVDISSQYTFNVIVPDGVVYTLGNQNRTVVVSDMEDDSATITFIGECLDKPTLFKIFSLAKSKQGFDGDPAVTYRLSVSDIVVRQTSAGLRVPEQLTVESLVQTAGEVPTLFPAYFLVEGIKEDSSRTTLLSTTSPVSSVSFPTLSEYDSFEITLYKDYTAEGGFQNRLDRENIPVLCDGADGVGSVGAVLRPRGEWSNTKIYGCFDAYRDVVIYGEDRKYYVAKEGIGSIPVGTLPTNTIYWEPFDDHENIATGLLLADNAYIDILGTSGIRIGNYPNCWEMTAGTIVHRVSGLSLTADGVLSAPDGLHIKIGDDTIADFTDQKIQTSVTEVKSYTDNKVSNLQIGGRNLLPDSKDVSDTPYLHSIGYTAAYRNLTRTLNAGETVIFSYSGVTSNSVVGFALYSLNSSIDVFPVNTPVTLTKSYTYFRVRVSTSAAFAADYMKLEVGTKATDWTPAPEDVQAELDSKVATTVYETGINQLSNQISLKASQTDLDALGNRVSATESEILLLPDKITLEVSKIQIGGRNHLLNSSLSSKMDWNQNGASPQFVTLEGVPCMRIVAGTGGAASGIYRSIPYGLKTANTITFSIDVYVTAVGGYMFFGVESYGADDAKIAYTFKDSDVGKWIRISVTGIPQNKNIVIYTYGNTQPVYYKNVKGEIGTNATDWTPAPEDVPDSLLRTGIDIEAGTITLDAAKTVITGSLIVKGIQNGGINVGGNCIITSTGLITAKGATIEGKITATSGSIGGVSISNNRIGIDSSSTSAVGSFLAAGYLGVRSKANYFRVDANDTELQCTINKQSDTTPCIDIKNTSTSGGSTAAMAMRTFGKNELYGGIQILSASATIIEDNAPKLEITKTDFGVTLRVNNTGEYVSGYLRITSSPATGGAATVQFVRD